MIENGIVRKTLTEAEAMSIKYPLRIGGKTLSDAGHVLVANALRRRANERGSTLTQISEPEYTIARKTLTRAVASIEPLRVLRKRHSNASHVLPTFQAMRSMLILRATHS